MNRRRFCSTSGAKLQRRKVWSENNPTTTVGGEKHRVRWDLWVDGRIESPTVLRSVRRALASDSEMETKRQSGESDNPTMARYAGDNESSKWYLGGSAEKRKFC
ncbi:hypothetical protein U1Q18_008329 [Sarracenia purpurea var. burkii]